MKQIAEFRVPELYAREFLPADLGSTWMDFVRTVKVPVGSPIYQRIGELYSLVLQRDKAHFFLGWSIHREYSREELESAELLRLLIAKTFEPAGAECGTVYDEQDACTVCGSGSRQLSALVLDENSIPKKVDIARTISDEIVVSQAFASVLQASRGGGYSLGPVHHKQGKAGSSTVDDAEWQQLTATSLVNVNALTRTGNDPFDEDAKNEYRCPRGHIAGLSLLSELYIDRRSWNGSDVAATRQLFGVNRNLLRASPLLVVSQAFYARLQEQKSKGFAVEIVKFAD